VSTALTHSEGSPNSFDIILFLDNVPVWRGPSDALDNPPDEAMAHLAMWQNAAGIQLPSPDRTAPEITEEMRKYHEQLRRTNEQRRARGEL
jgi:hypothetical protein